MKSNGLLKWLMIPFGLLMVFIGIKLLAGHRGTKIDAPEAAKQLNANEMKALGLEGDTPRDTVATLVGQVKQLRNELQTAAGENKNQRIENDRLRQRETAIDQRVQSALEGERSRLQQDREQISGDKQQTQSLLQDLQQRLDSMSKRGGGSGGGGADMPVGLGLDGVGGRSADSKSADGADIRWIEPIDAKRADGKAVDAKKTGNASGGDAGFSFPTSFASAQKTLESAGDAVTETANKATFSATADTPAATPVYTVPSNSTLMGSVAMTALVGRVPIDGTVNDPYPFKVLIGPDNLTANGIDLPGVSGAVVSGTSSGDWTLSCVRGQIRSVTFVFDDGTIRTVPDDSGKNGGGESSQNAGQNAGNGGSNQSTQGGLGWISDPHGIPCVSGERRSNAQQYLGSQALITAAGAGAASVIKSKNGGVSVTNNGSGSLGTVGISGNEAMGRILAGGVQATSDWVNKLYGQAFAAVYVEPGAPVAIHLERPLHIDYDYHGRKVDHRLGAPHAASNLD